MLVYPIFAVIETVLMYLYLREKTGVSLKLIWYDIIIVLVVNMILAQIIGSTAKNVFTFFIVIIMIPTIGLFACLLRFYRKPKRECSEEVEDIVSPADGNVIYIKKVDKNILPVSIKNGRLSKLEELTKTDLLSTPSWIIGINMTPFDVHKNCSPIKGKIILNKHTDGKFLSLKSGISDTDNERNTFVIENDKFKIGVIQIASRLVRRIVSYRDEGMIVEKGEWIGMIKFGSQVDIILPQEMEIKIKLGQQVYAGRTSIAKYIGK